MAERSKVVWFLVVPRTGLLDIAGPWEVLGHANDVLGRPAYQLELVGPRGPALPTRYGLAVGGVRPLPKASRRLPDVAIVAGGSPRSPLPDGEAKVVPWLRRHRARIRTLVSICTGAFMLGEAGVQTVVARPRIGNTSAI